MEDSALISKFKESGDRRAFENIISKYEDRIFRFGFRMCGQVQDAEDVVQDTFVSAFRYLKDFREEASLLSWLLKIASSACLKKRRLKKNEPRHHVPYEELALGPTGEPPRKEDLAERPDELVQSAEVQRLFREALAQLPPIYKEIVALREMEGLSGKDVAASLGISESAVKVRLHRARAMMFTEFKKVYDGLGDETDR
jgi:RNA polymerase sigma-70 factor, ECF subfamily